MMKNGIATTDSPYVFKSEAKSLAKYESICRDLLGDNFEEIYGSGGDYVFGRVNEYLMGMGLEVAYYSGVPLI